MARSFSASAANKCEMRINVRPSAATRNGTW
jgi:hypothetical protein